MLFGYNIQVNGYSEDRHVQNVIILLGKLFINKTRVDEKTVNVTEFLRYLRPLTHRTVQEWQNKVKLQEKLSKF